MKVPHFTLTACTDFPYISYKFTHFCFSCSPHISLKLRQLQLRFTHVTYSNLAAVRYSALCSSRWIVKHRCDFPCENLYKRSANAFSNSLAFFSNLSNAARSFILFEHVWRSARIANLHLILIFISVSPSGSWPKYWNSFIADLQAVTNIREHAW